MENFDFSKPIAPYKPDPDVTAIYGGNSDSAPPIVPPTQSTAPASNTGLTVNVRRPTLAQNTTTATDAPPANAGTVAIQPPPGVRAARSVKNAVGTAMDVVGGANDIAGIPGKALAGAAGAIGNFASDFGGEYFGGGNPPALAAPAAKPVTAPPVATNPNAVDAPSKAPGVWPPPLKTAAAQPTPTLLGGTGQPATQTTQPIKPALLSTTAYQPLSRTVGKDGNISITGSGQSPEYLARMQAEGKNQAGVPIKPPGATSTGIPDFSKFKRWSAEDQKAYGEFSKAYENMTKTESNERIALLNHAMTSSDTALRISSAEKIAKMNSEALNKQVHVVQIGEETDPSDPMTKKKVYGMSMIGEDGKPVVTDLTGKPITAQPARTEAPKSAIEYLKSNPSTKAQFMQKYGYLPAGI